LPITFQSILEGSGRVHNKWGYLGSGAKAAPHLGRMV
jgi:hypothetical protein